MQKGASVIVCCYNSEARLPQTLEHLVHQRISLDLTGDDFGAEVIIVNNNSNDHTVAVCETYRNRFRAAGIQLRIIDELKPGQMYARMAGVNAATYECIVFCDDDNWLDENYIRAAYSMLAGNETIGAGGGKNLPVTEVTPPEWFEECKDKYATGIPADHSGDVSLRGFVLGAGMVTRKHLYQALFSEHFPSLLPGRSGASLATGDDFEYCKRLLLKGYRLYYDERLKLHHFIPAERLTVAYREKLMAGIANAGKVLAGYDRAIHIFNKIKNKSRLRLLLLAPGRMLFSKLGISSRDYRDECLVWYYVLPAFVNRRSTNLLIKKFMLSKEIL